MLTPVSLYGDSTITLDETGAPALSSYSKLEWSSDHSHVTEVDIIFRDPPFINHYFHFVEIAVIAFSMMATFVPKAKVRRIYFGNQPWNNADQNCVQKDIIQALFNPERIVEGTPEGDDIFSKSLVLVVDESGYIDVFYNKYIEPIVPYARRTFPRLGQKP